MLFISYFYITWEQPGPQCSRNALSSSPTLSRAKHMGAYLGIQRHDNHAPDCSRSPWSAVFGLLGGQHRKLNMIVLARLLLLMAGRVSYSSSRETYAEKRQNWKLIRHRRERRNIKICNPLIAQCKVISSRPDWSQAQSAVFDYI